MDPDNGRVLNAAAYMKPCSRSDPNFSECALENIRISIPHLENGDPEYRIPNFKALKIDNLNMDSGEHIKLYANNVTLFGLPEAEVKEFKWNFEKKEVFARLYIPEVNILGTYGLNGQNLIMKLKGTGQMNDTLYGVDINLKAKYSMKAKKGQDHMAIDKIEIQMGYRTVHFDFDNLLNNPEISKNLNKFLNENWKLLIEDLQPQISAAISSVLIPVVNSITSRIAFDNIILP